MGIATAAGVFGICTMGAKASENSADWQDYVTERVHSTYKYFGGGLAMTAGSAYLLFRSGTIHRMLASHPMAFSIGGMVVTIGSMIVTRSISQENTVAKLAAWSTFNIAMGATLAPSFFLGGPMVLRAALYTGAVVGGLSLVAMSARNEQFLSWGQPLALGLGVVFVTSLGRVFLPAHYFVAASIMDAVVVYGGLAVFSGLTIYDTQKIIYKAKGAREYDAINESIHIYLDAVNMFQLILNLMAGRRK
jgi:FtsH-binding integral membrane protein